MPSITKEQVLKLQAQAPKGWKFDWKYYVTHGEKTLCCLIEQDANHVIKARIEYYGNYEKRTSYDGRTTYNVPANHSHICLHVSTWTVDANGTGHSFGLGHFENLDNGQHTRKNYKDLCKIAATVTDETIKSYTADCKDRPLFLG